MGLTPYREPAERLPDLDPAPTGRKSGLLGLRTQFRSPWWFLRAKRTFLWTFLILGMNLFATGFTSLLGIWGMAGLFSLSAVVVLGEWLLKKLRGEVDLHHGGVVVHRWGKREEILFEDVDELWLVGTFRTRAVRLVRFDHTEVEVPLGMDRGARLREMLEESCSLSLSAVADGALASDDPLDFRAVIVTRQGLRLGGELFEWTRLASVREEDGVLGWRLRGGRTFSLLVDQVPHPRLLLELSKKLIQQARSQRRPGQRIAVHTPPPKKLGVRTRAAGEPLEEASESSGEDRRRTETL